MEMKTFTREFVTIQLGESEIRNVFGVNRERLIMIFTVY